MTTYRENLPQFENSPFITDGGLETSLVFEKNIELPEFAAFPLLFSDEGIELLREYYLPYLETARKKQYGFILESPTWRASQSWGEKLGYSLDQVMQANTRSIQLMSDLRKLYSKKVNPLVISGCLGPKGDGYQIKNKMTVDEAKKYHLEQIQTFSKTEADLASAFTLNYTEEAIGITLAARDCSIPVVIGFTVETDGRLPSGQPLGNAILEVDARTGNGPAYYMINCAHPKHFEQVLHDGESWLTRIRAVRANASCKSHAELDESVELDRGNPQELGQDYKKLKENLTKLNVFGGCCGTDHTHIEHICNCIS